MSQLYITTLSNFRCSHKYLSLPLIPVEEFLSLHPEHAESDPHDLMIARINHEHAEREKLEQARQELLKRKQALIAENNKRKDDLASLDQDLERFIDVSSKIPSCVCLNIHLTFSYRPQNRSKSSLKSSISLIIEGCFSHVGKDTAFYILSIRDTPFL